MAPASAGPKAGGGEIVTANVMTWGVGEGGTGAPVGWGRGLAGRQVGIIWKRDTAGTAGRMMNSVAVTVTGRGGKECGRVDASMAVFLIRCWQRCVAHACCSGGTRERARTHTHTNTRAH